MIQKFYEFRRITTTERAIHKFRHCLGIWSWLVWRQSGSVFLQPWILIIIIIVKCPDINNDCYHSALSQYKISISLSLSIYFDHKVLVWLLIILISSSLFQAKLVNGCLWFSEWLNKTEVHNRQTLTKAVELRPADRGLVTISNHTSCIDDPLMWGRYAQDSVK